MFGKSVINSLMIVMIFSLLPFVNSCSDQKEEAQTHSIIVPAKEKFYLGLIPEHDLFSQKKRYLPLVQYIAGKTGLDIKIKVLSRYGNIIENFNANELDAAFFGSFTGALAIKKIEVEPLARPLWIDGTSTYFGMIFVRKDSGIKNASDMKGKRFAFVDKATTAGWLLPLHYFKDIAINDYRTWFSETYFSGTHEDAIYDVLDGRADIGAAKNTVFNRLAKIDGRLLSELQILKTSIEVPANTLAVRKGLADSFKKKLKDIMLQMNQTEQGRGILHEFGAQGFVETSQKDYEPVFNYSSQVGLDLKRYNYLND